MCCETEIRERHKELYVQQVIVKNINTFDVQEKTSRQFFFPDVKYHTHTHTHTISAIFYIISYMMNISFAGHLLSHMEQE